MMQKLKVGAALVAVIVAGTAPLARTGSAWTGSGVSVLRVAGYDRYATAVAVSAFAFPRGARVALVASGEDFADAVVAASEARGFGPVLLTERGALRPETASELQRLVPQKVVVIGGARAVGDEVVRAIEHTVAASVSRVAGEDRYATAATASAAAYPRGASVAYVTTGERFADAIVAASAAGGRGPVLLVGRGGVPGATARELSRLGVREIVVVGGTTAVSSAQARTLANETGATVSRVSGADRYSTTAALSAASFRHRPRMTAYISTGVAYPDPLSAAAATAGASPLLLVEGSNVRQPTIAGLGRLRPARVVVVGGRAAINDQALGVLRDAAEPPAPAQAPGAAEAVATAKAQLGKPYQWGGAGPDSFDCSGLTSYAWRAGSVSLPHNAAAQADVTVPVGMDQLAPGDLLFFGSPDDISHVGIYIGSAQMIEAAHAGAPVRIASFSDRPDLVAAGRPEPSQTGN